MIFDVRDSNQKPLEPTNDAPRTFLFCPNGVFLIGALPKTRSDRKTMANTTEDLNPVFLLVFLEDLLGAKTSIGREGPIRLGTAQ